MHDSQAHLPRGQPAGQGLSAGFFSQGHAQASLGTRSRICTTTSSTRPQPLQISGVKPDLDVLALPRGCHCFFFIWGYFYIQWHSTLILRYLNQCPQLLQSI